MRVSSCGLFFPQHMPVLYKNITKRERKRMFFEDLKENYTKVLVRPVETQVSIQPKLPVNNFKSKAEKLIKSGLKIALIAGTIYIGFGSDFAFANGIIETKAKELYYGQFLGIAKWVVIGKAGWDTIHKMLKEDFDGAKRTFLQYLVIFCILWGLPAALNTVEGVFKGV